MTDIIRVVIADRNPVLRAGLHSFLGQSKSMIEVIGETGNYEDTLALIKQTQPHLVLMDISLCRSENEINELRQICACNGNHGVVVMIDENDIIHIIQSLSGGAIGVITKDIDANELVWIVHQIAKKQRALAPAVIDTLVDYLLQHEIVLPNCEPAMFEALTNREHEILDLLRQGLSNQEIAEVHSLSIGTVKCHVSNILSKLGLNRRQIMLTAISKPVNNGNKQKGQLC